MGLLGLPTTQTLWLNFDGAGFDQPTLQLLEAEVDEFESILGCLVRSGPRRAKTDATWIVAPRQPNDAPSLRWDPTTQTLQSGANGPDEVFQTMQLLHTLVRRPDEVAEYVQPATPVTAAHQLRDVVLGTFPSFSLRDKDPDAWVGTRLAQIPAEWSEFTRWAQEWVAELQDAHSAVINLTERGFNPPYVGSLTPDGIQLEEVPATSAAGAAGVKAGWRLEVEDPERWNLTTGATPQQHARIAARRAMAFHGDHRVFRARPPQAGAPVSWVEPSTTPTLGDVLDVERTPNGTLAVRLRAFRAGIGVEEAFDDLCRGASESDHMVLDLRGNTGGDLVLAMSLRDRFLRERTQLGSIAFSSGLGSLATPRERWAEPSQRPRWPGTLTILLDSMTYSAAEDFILGLQGLEHVTVAGSRSGGGSGRALELPLGPELVLRVSTAITYDRQGRPVEYLGIAPD